MCEQLCKKCKNDFEMAKTCQSCKHKNQIFYVSSEYLHACAHSKRAIGVRPPIPQSGERFDYFDCCDKHEEEKKRQVDKVQRVGKTCILAIAEMLFLRRKTV